MISRRRLLGTAAAAAIVPTMSPPAALPTTWGAGTAAIDLAAAHDMTIFALTRLQAGIMTIGEVRAFEGLPPLDPLDFSVLLRGETTP